MLSRSTLGLSSLGELSIPQGRFAPMLMHGDCLERMDEIADGSVDMILCDLPYGTTSCSWDSIIPLDQLWEQYNRIISSNGAIVLTASQPFTSSLLMSNIKCFKHAWVWDKDSHANFALAKYQPLKIHEDILVFSRGTVNYYPVKERGPINHSRKQGRVVDREILGGSRVEPASDLSGMKYPKSIQVFPKHSSHCGLHPTQKPISLMDYMIRTYSLYGQTVLDNCFGSCTTGVAAYRLGRRFIGIEKDGTYFAIGEDRMRQEITERLAV